MYICKMHGEPLYFDWRREGLLCPEYSVCYTHIWLENLPRAQWASAICQERTYQPVRVWAEYMPNHQAASSQAIRKRFMDRLRAISSHLHRSIAR